MSYRRKTREVALQLLYALEVSNEPLDILLQTLLPKEIDLSYLKNILTGVTKYRLELDKIIAEHSKNWILDRISIIDKNILRMALFELLYNGTVPPEVAINEAIELSKKFSTKKSPGFINGILGEYYRKHSGKND